MGVNLPLDFVEVEAGCQSQIFLRLSARLRAAAIQGKVEVLTLNCLNGIITTGQLVSRFCAQRGRGK